MTSKIHSGELDSCFKPNLPPLIHLLIILLILPRRDVIHPRLIFEIPAHRLLDALLELEAWFPAQFLLELGRVDGVAQVVTGTVGHIGDQAQRLALGITQQAIHRPDDHFDQVDVLPLVEAANVVGVSYLALVEDQVDRPGMILHIEPVAHVLALAIDRQRLALADVVDEQWDQLFRELVRTVVVRAVGHDGRQAVGVVEGSHEMVAARLRCRIGAMRVILRCLVEEFLSIGQMVLAGRGGRGEGRLDPFGMAQLEGAIHLVGRDVIETLALIFLRQRFPIEFRRLQQAQRTHHVGTGEGEGILDGAVHMALGRQMDNAVHLMLLH